MLTTMTDNVYDITNSSRMQPLDVKALIREVILEMYDELKGANGLDGKDGNTIINDGVTITNLTGYATTAIYKESTSRPATPSNLINILDPDTGLVTDAYGGWSTDLDDITLTKDEIKDGKLIYVSYRRFKPNDAGVWVASSSGWTTPIPLGSGMTSSIVQEIAELYVETEYGDAFSSALLKLEAAATDRDTWASITMQLYSVFGNDAAAYINKYMRSYASAHLAYAADLDTLRAEVGGVSAELLNQSYVFAGTQEKVWYTIGDMKGTSDGTLISTMDDLCEHTNTLTDVERLGMLGQVAVVNPAADAPVYYQFVNTTTIGDGCGWVQTATATGMTSLGGAKSLFVDDDGNITGWEYAAGTGVGSQSEFTISAGSFQVASPTGTVTLDVDTSTGATTFNGVGSAYDTPYHAKSLALAKEDLTTQYRTVGKHVHITEDADNARYNIYKIFIDKNGTKDLKYVGSSAGSRHAIMARYEAYDYHLGGAANGKSYTSGSDYYLDALNIHGYGPIDFRKNLGLSSSNTNVSIRNGDMIHVNSWDPSTGFSWWHQLYQYSSTTGKWFKKSSVSVNGLSGKEEDDAGSEAEQTAKAAAEKAAEDAAVIYKDDVATKMGFGSYADMVAIYQEDPSGTVITGGFINTGLIATDAVLLKSGTGAFYTDENGTSFLDIGNANIRGNLTANHIDATSLKVKALNVTGDFSADQIYAGTEGSSGGGTNIVEINDSTKYRGIYSYAKRGVFGLGTVYGVTGQGDNTGVSGLGGFIGVYGWGSKGVECGTNNTTSGEWGLWTSYKVNAGGGYYEFTGSHITNTTSNPVIGDIMYVEKAYGLDPNTSYTLSQKTVDIMDKRVIGVYDSSSSSIDNHIRESRHLSNIEYDDEGTVLSSAIKPEYVDILQSILSEGYIAISVNALGEGMINVCSYNGNITSGDYICSSIVPGKGMRQDDDILHNYTVAKALESVGWDNETLDDAAVYEQEGSDGNMYKCKMIACTYHCG